MTKRWNTKYYHLLDKVDIASKNRLIPKVLSRNSTSSWRVECPTKKERMNYVSFYFSLGVHHGIVLATVLSNFQKIEIFVQRTVHG